MELAEARTHALSLPETTEQPHFDMASFRVRGKIFATVPPEGDRLPVFVDARVLPATVRAGRAGPGERRLAMARLIRETFEELGGTFSKFGQLVGSAPSLFGDEVAHEFRGFLDRGQPIPYAAVAETVAAELGRPV